MGFRENLPHQPFSQAPLVWGTEPTPSGGRPAPGMPSQPTPVAGIILSVVPIYFAARVSGVAGVYPQATRVATQGFTTPIGLLSASLATSVINATSDQPVFVFVARDSGASINVLNGSDILVAHICEQGLGHSQRSGVGFADDIAPKYGGNQNIAIYVSSSGTGVAGNRISAGVVLRYFSFA